MRAERLFRALGLVDPALVEEALAARRRAVPWRRWGALAACLALVIGFGWLAAGGFGDYGSGMSGGADSGSSGGDSAAPGSSGGPGENSGGGAGGVGDGIAFLSYAGPVLPLSTVEAAAGLTAGLLKQQPPCSLPYTQSPFLLTHTFFSFPFIFFLPNPIIRY